MSAAAANAGKYEPSPCTSYVSNRAPMLWWRSVSRTQIPTTRAPTSSAAKPKKAILASSLVPPRLRRVVSTIRPIAQHTTTVVVASMPSTIATNGPAPYETAAMVTVSAIM